jgi:AbrB family looped-hinge helix DNA binding protein
MTSTTISMPTLVQFQSRGVLSIPKAIRDLLNLAQGSLAKVFVKNGAIVIKPVRVAADEDFVPRTYSKKEIERWIKEDTLDAKTNKKLDELFKKQGVYDDPIVKKWLAYYDK